MTRVISALAVFLLLAACSGSASLNPGNWFSGGRSDASAGLVPEGSISSVDPRPLVEEVTDVAIERIPGGAVLRARGRVAVTGWWGVDLVSDADRSGSGVLAFTFRGIPPEADAPAQPGGAASRVVVAATFVSDADLAGVSQVQVAGRTNVRALRP